MITWEVVISLFYIWVLVSLVRRLRRADYTAEKFMSGPNAVWLGSLIIIHILGIVVAVVYALAMGMVSATL